MKTKELTNEQIVAICDQVIEIVKEKERLKTYVFLCSETMNLICDVLKIDYTTNSDVVKYISKFTQKNAAKYANSESKGVWWNLVEYENRILFMQWIKSQYQNKENESN